MKRIVWRLGSIVLAALLLLSLAACGMRREIVISSEVEAPTVRSSTDGFHSVSQKTKTDAESSSRSSTDGARSVAQKTETNAAAPTVINVMRKSWESLSADAKKTLADCGMKKEDLVVDKAKLTYDKEKSQTDTHPKYATYTYDGKAYSFNDLHGKLTSITYPIETSQPMITEEKAKQIAATVADLIIDTTKYTFYDYVHANQGSHTIVYRRQVGKYVTLEGLLITISGSGKMESIHISKLGLFDGVKEPTVSEEWLYAECEKILKSRYEKYKSHTMKSLKLDIKDGQFLAYYKKQPDIPYGQMVMICECYPSFTKGLDGRGEFILVPIK